MSDTLLGLAQSPSGRAESASPSSSPRADLTTICLVLQKLGSCVLEVREAGFSPSALAHSGQRRKRKTGWPG